MLMQPSLLSRFCPEGAGTRGQRSGTARACLGHRRAGAADRQLRVFDSHVPAGTPARGPALR